jgi:hypothetical protein
MADYSHRIPTRDTEDITFLPLTRTYACRPLQLATLTRLITD